MDGEQVVPNNNNGDPSAGTTDATDATDAPTLLGRQLLPFCHHHAECTGTSPNGVGVGPGVRCVTACVSITLRKQLT